MRRLVLSLSLALMMLTGAVASAAPNTPPPPAGCAWTQVAASAWTSDAYGHKVQAVLQEKYDPVNGFCGYIRTVANFQDSTTTGEYYTHDQWDTAGTSTKYGELGPTYEIEPGTTSWTLYGPQSAANIWCGYVSHATYTPGADPTISASAGACTF